ncbi:hypothetical protein Scep_000311 [Stephania cephalantha]|uniref:Uncharacterized protein n=1 Tax=Stephania cephalantha TaxID=152367 RepID=A0AAP0L8L4_9MAGN
MEAMLLSPTPDQSISHYSKRNRNPRRIMFHSFISRPSLENLSVHGGLIGPPPSISSILSHPPRPPPPHHHHHHQQQIRKQLTPPLLPLPISPPPPPVKSRYSSLPSRTTTTTINNIMVDNAKSNTSTCSVQANRKTNSKSRGGGGGGGGGGVDVAAKKPRSSPRTRKQLSHESDRLGPDPRDLPKKVLLVSNSVADHESVNNVGVGVGDEEFSCSIFSLAPPPSSLPLPRFSLKPKLGGCNVVDAGATDNLRRLLRLR